MPLIILTLIQRIQNTQLRSHLVFNFFYNYFPPFFSALYFGLEHKFFHYEESEVVGNKFEVDWDLLAPFYLNRSISGDTDTEVEANMGMRVEGKVDMGIGVDYDS